MPAQVDEPAYHGRRERHARHDLVTDDLLNGQDIQAEVVAVEIKGAILMYVGQGLGLCGQGLLRIDKVGRDRTEEAFDVQKLRDATLDDRREHHTVPVSL